MKSAYIIDSGVTLPITIEGIFVMQEKNLLAAYDTIPDLSFDYLIIHTRTPSGRFFETAKHTPSDIITTARINKGHIPIVVIGPYENVAEEPYYTKYMSLYCQGRPTERYYQGLLHALSEEKIKEFTRRQNPLLF